MSPLWLSRKIKPFKKKANNMISVSVISPVCNEQENLNELYQSIKRNISFDYDWELILIDDGSADNSLQIIKDLCRQDKRVFK